MDDRESQQSHAHVDGLLPQLDGHAASELTCLVTVGTADLPEAESHGLTSNNVDSTPVRTQRCRASPYSEQASPGMFLFFLQQHTLIPAGQPQSSQEFVTDRHNVSEML
eukprot:jgi/Ulvmu1/5738/UM245_0006.1